MKRYSHITVSICLILGAFWMSACTKWMPQEAPQSHPNDLIEWQMCLDSPTTRAAMNADGSGSFEEGDTIVVYARNLVNGQIQHYTLYASNGKWMPKIRWAETGDEVEFTAWHVAGAYRLHEASQSSSNYQHTLAADQRDEGYRASDLLLAQTQAKAGETVTLNFTHALSRLHIVLESKDGSYTDAQLQQAEVEVLTPCQIPFQLNDGTQQTPSGDQWITPQRGENLTWTALLSPQRAEAMSADGWIRIRIDGAEKMVSGPQTLNGEPFSGLEAGKELTYRLNIQKGDTPDTFAGTTRWVYGVQEPTDDQWNYDRTQLAWKEGCGWFDCNKVDPSNTTASGDGLMCWAAATSNLIHWWLQQNSGTAAVQAYTGPSALPTDMLHSAIFQLYKNHFPNAGEYPLKAINWFFNGGFYRTLYETDPIDPAAGFFRPQLGINSLGAEYIGTEMKRDRFNAIIKQALNSQQGILFVVNMGRWSTHAVTLWGVQFDEQGFVKTLYMVDNNDGKYDTRGTIRTMEVQYLPYSSTNADLYPYVPNSLGDFTIRIESLCTLSLGRQWIQ